MTRVYSGEQERAVRVQRLVEDWASSGLIDSAQRARLTPGLQVDLRRTNLFLRLTLMAFGLLIVGAAVGLLIMILDLDEEETVGILCLIAAVACAALAEFLIGRFRFYRFGIEEACAGGAALLSAVGSGLISDYSLGTLGDTRSLVMLLAGSVAGFVIFLRYGYVYGALAAMFCLATAPFQLYIAETVTRSMAAGLLMACFAAARRKRVRYHDEFPGDDYGWIQAAAWVGIYATLNLHLTGPAFGRSHPSWFYWLTYAGIWALPAAGLWISIRERDRPLLDASLAIALVTLATNKPYLGLTRREWDPILLGVFLMGTAIFVRRWLSSGPDGSRRGFTASRHLRSQKDLPAAAGLASAAFHPGGPRQIEPPSDDEFGGGRSGGGGAGSSF